MHRENVSVFLKMIAQASLSDIIVKAPVKAVSPARRTNGPLIPVGIVAREYMKSWLTEVVDAPLINLIITTTDATDAYPAKFGVEDIVIGRLHPIPIPILQAQMVALLEQLPLKLCEVCQPVSIFHALLEPAPQDKSSIRTLAPASRLILILILIPILTLIPILMMMNQRIALRDKSV